mgnify:CR=1 FL=1
MKWKSLMRLKEEKVDSDQQADKMEIINIYNKFKSCGSVTTDSRTLKGVVAAK